MKDHILTYTKKWFAPSDPEKDAVCIEDIAHALSLMVRANGHFPEFYSVAQHSVLCAKNCAVNHGTRREQLACLLHDASEAYLSDITRPVKHNLAEYKRIESRLQDTIYERFLGNRLTEEEKRMVKKMDDGCLYYEFLHYMDLALDDGIPDMEFCGDFYKEDPQDVEIQFLKKFRELYEEESK